MSYEFQSFDKPSSPFRVEFEGRNLYILKKFIGIILEQTYII